MIGQTFYLRDAINSSAYLQLRPSWSFENDETLIRVDAPTMAGGYTTFQQFGRSALQFNVGLEWVNSADRAQLNTWWADQRELIFTMNLSATAIGSAMTTICRIANQVEPLGMIEPARPDRFRGGVLLLESRGIGQLVGNPFILDVSALDGPDILL